MTERSASQQKPARQHRRVHLPAVPGTDPAPQATDAPARATEDTDRAWGDRGADSNDDRLKGDVPPHW